MPAGESLETALTFDVPFPTAAEANVTPISELQEPKVPVKASRASKKSPPVKSASKPKRETDDEKTVRIQTLERLQAAKESLTLKNKELQESLDAARAQIAGQIKKLKFFELELVKQKDKAAGLADEVLHLQKRLAEANPIQSAPGECRLFIQCD